MKSLPIRALVFASILATFAIAHGQSIPPPQPASTQAAQTSPAENAATDSVPFKPITQVTTKGQGPINVVLIPGLACDGSVWDEFMSRNADKYTMHAVTLPGFGGTAPPDKAPPDIYGTWLENAVIAVWRVIQDRNIGNPVIMGHSMGGHLALRLGTAHAKDLRAIITVDGAPAFQFGPANMDAIARIGMADQMTDMYRSLPPDQYADSMRLFFSRMVTDPKRGLALGDMSAKVPRETTLQYMSDLFSADIRADLGRITIPVLAMPAVATRDLTPDMAQQIRDNWVTMMAGAPLAKIAVFEDTRHFIMDDRPAEFDDAVADFLAGREVTGVSALPQSEAIPDPPSHAP